jgi:hypothetical protein
MQARQDLAAPLGSPSFGVENHAQNIRIKTFFKPNSIDRNTSQDRIFVR